MIQNIIFLCSLPVIFGFNLDQTHPPTILGRDEKLRISTLPNTLSFDQQIDWNQGTVYDQSHQPLLTTSPSQMPDLIDIRGGNDDNDQIITSLNLTTESCPKAIYTTTGNTTFTFQPHLWIINSGKPESFVHYQFIPSSNRLGSLSGRIQLTESPYSLVALIEGTSDKSQYNVKYQNRDRLGLSIAEYVSLFIVVGEHHSKCDGLIH